MKPPTALGPRLLAAFVVIASASPLAARASATTSAEDGSARVVEVDVLPGVTPNHLVVGSGVEIPVAVLTTPAFDAATADGSSLCFGDAEDPAARDCTEEHGHGHHEDVDADGDLDLLLHYQEPETGIDRGDSRACLSGRTREGGVIEGCDDIVTS